MQIHTDKIPATYSYLRLYDEIDRQNMYAIFVDLVKHKKTLNILVLQDDITNFILMYTFILLFL